MESLGLLKNLNLYDCFTFSNGYNAYSVIEKKGDIVKYRKISRGQKSNPKSGIEWNNKNCKIKSYLKEFEINGDIEVYDFLPF